MGSRLACFKTYDVRGKVPLELNEERAERIASGYAEEFSPRQVAVGYDMRLTSPGLAAAVSEGLRKAGCDVHELGLCGTEEVYFAATHLDGGIMVTASHNPAEYNGMKLVSAKARPVNAEELARIEERARQGSSLAAPQRGRSLKEDWRSRYVDALTERFPANALAGMKMVANAGNGSVSPLLNAIRQRYDLDVQVLFPEPDGTFPNGVPNPLLPEKRKATSDAVVAAGAQLGIAWDGDFDRCFFFDSRGQFLESYYLVGLFAQYFMGKGEKRIAYDPRLTWNTEEIVTRLGGEPLLCKTGHIYFKQFLRETGAAYGGEMSGHHYFHGFGCCDSGIWPWFLYLSLQAEAGSPLEEQLHERARLFPISGEINRQVSDPGAALARIAAHYRPQCVREMDLDGVSMEFPQWRFNLRPSNTEPLTRLNVESRGNPDLVAAKTAEILALLDECS